MSVSGDQSQSPSKPAGSQVSVSCISRGGKPSPAFTWYLGDQEILDHSLEVSQEDREKEKMIKFIQVIESSGLSLKEADVYMPTNPHISNHRSIQRKKIQPWSVLEPED